MRAAAIVAKRPETRALSVGRPETIKKYMCRFSARAVPNYRLPSFLCFLFVRFGRHVCYCRAHN